MTEIEFTAFTGTNTNESFQINLIISQTSQLKP